LLAWMASSLTFKQVSVPTPLRGEAARNPFYAAILLGRTLDVDASWEQVFTQPPRGSVLVLSGWNWTLSRLRRERIEKWVEDGGRLVVDGLLLGDGKDFERWTGIGHEDFEDTVSTASCNVLTEDGSQRQFEVCGVDVSQTLTSSRENLWALRQDDRMDAVRVAVGRGSVTAINGDPFRRRAFLKADNPRLFLAASQLHRDDSVLFLSEDEQSSLLALVWRFGAPAVLLLLAAVAMALWRSAVRFGPRVAAIDSARRSLAEQIRGTGRFITRFGGGRALHAAASRALRDAAQQRIHNYGRLSAEERVAALARVCGLQGGDLAHAMNFSGARNSHELRHAIAVLETARRHLLSLRRSRHGN
jgi:hypothetical protein